MGQSYRIRTELGVNKTINVQLDQEFEFLEILSLKIQQADIYTRSCADYGVIVGRVTANNGLGIPNARVAVFIPVTSVDESNPLISSIYPYKSPSNKNEDGYRYNLLSYEKSYSKHAATGTLPTRSDALTGLTAVEIYDTYYKFTTKTNESGDYMIMGVPLGDQAIVMDVDLSDIGEFSLTPQDLIRMGLATEAQVAGSKFRTSNDLNSLPQIINLTKNIEVSPLWGDPTLCQIAINRLDFDLRDDANVDIQPTSVFMGCTFSSPDSLRVKYNGFPKDDMGNLCGLTTSPGQILALRQTIRQDIDGNPVLEQYELEQSGNVIDGAGTWLIELPMNLDYFVTNEFGEKILSNDPTVGVPTKAKYRFKVKWTQPNDLTLSTRRGYYLVPNVKEYGWTGSVDPSPNSLNPSVNTNTKKQQESSYYFGLAWSGYTNGFIGQKKIDRLNEIIDCEDTFYEFQYNRVYTVSSLIDQYKSGRNFIGSAPGRFIGIKEIDSQDCEGSVNKFPVNDGFRNFDLLFFLFSIIFTVIQPIGLILLTIAHILLWLYNLVLQFLCWISKIGISTRLFSWHPFKGWRKYCTERENIIRLPMITYPDCQACDCKQSTSVKPNNGASQPAQGVTGSGVLSYVSSPSYYYDGLASTYFSADTENQSVWSTLYGESFAGLSLVSNLNNPGRYKLPFSQQMSRTNGGERFVTSFDLPIGERINVFNLRESYFSNINKIKVTFAKDSNIGKYHYDNTITVLSQQQFETGELITFVNVTGTTDINYLYSATTTGGTITGISGETYNGSGATTIDVSYATTQVSNVVTPVRYNLPYGSDETNYKFPADVEYYQVITAITVSEAAKIWNTGTTQSFGNVLNSVSTSAQWEYIGGFVRQWRVEASTNWNAFQYFESAGDQYILVLQRGVDPYSPKYVNEYCLGNLFGTTEFDPNWTVTASTRVNIPIQKLENSSTSVQGYNQNEMFYQSYFFKPGTTTSSVPGQSFSGFNTTNTAYYSSLDASTNPLPIGATLQGVAPNNPGTLGSAKRITRSGLASASDVSGCNLAYTNTDSLFVQNIAANATPRLNVRMYNDYDSFFGYRNPFNGGNLWWKMNWGGVFYSVKVNSSGYIGGFISCIDLATLPKVISLSTNGFYAVNSSSIKYDNSEDLSGGAVMRVSTNGLNGRLLTDYVNDLGYYYTTKTFFSYNPTMLIDNAQLNILRTDRLPSSDTLDGGSWTTNPSLLQQNLHFGFYSVNTDSDDITSQGFQTGAQTVTADLAGLPNSFKVLESFDCEKMVGLDCYTGFGDNFGIDQACTTADAVESGCYMFLRRPLTDLKKDWDNFGEWGFRFRFFYGLCRGVLSQSFMNNWINGSLYAFPIQVNTYYNSKNKPEYPRFPNEVVYFNQDSNNFYYRSSPWNDTTNKFVGRPATDTGTVNSLNLLYPTTIINLGIKDYFYSEITFDPSTKGYILPNINPTSYGDTSDLVNLFVISRITDESFLSQIISLGDNGIDQLFSRRQKRIDGDLAQLLSINSEIGNVNFSPEFYEIFDGAINPTTILGSAKEPIMAVWYSSTTQDLQTKDYLTPGRIDFRGPNNVGYYPYPYGIKSQLVPFYQWKLASGSNTIFGNQNNTWATDTADIIQSNYQSLDRTTTNTKYYLNGTSVANELTARGYIYSVDGNVTSYPTVGGRYTSTPQTKNKFLVGAPYQFYFGVVKGESALDRFKTKYSVDE